MRLAVLGPAVLDRFYLLTHLPAPGESALVQRRLLDAGGKGLNQAVAAARTGAPTWLLATVGADRTGRLLRRVAAREGITSPWLATRRGTSDESVIWVDPCGRQMIASRLQPGAWLPSALPEALHEALAAGARLLLAGPLPAEIWAPHLSRLAAAGVALQLNLAPFPCDYGDLWPHLDLVVANEAEMRLHLGCPPEAAARALLARGVRRVVVTRGAEGALWFAADETFALPAPRVSVVDTTAAGDVLAGVLAARLWAGAPPRAALALAVRAASATVTRLGAWRAIPTRAHLRRWQRELAGG